ncbi:MAG: pseudouridine synthase [Candidatus Cloacimonadota bacterium]|nr:pseudouridine synthase [Candidatus Cloacimonadota bacterium]
MRINKFLATAGLGSRRSVEELVANGKIKVNDKIVVDLATRIDENKDIVFFKNKRIILPQTKIYVMLNKPVGYISTSSDPFARDTVFNLLPKFPVRIFSVGRLDKPSSGLLLFTNDGEWANKITHPKTKIQKVYIVHVKGNISKDDLYKLRNGVQLKEGKTLPAKVFVKSYNKSNDISKIRIVLYEGKKRQIRRMIENIGHTVTELKRTKVHSIRLADLSEGSWRYLKDKEISSIRKPNLYKRK